VKPARFLKCYWPTSWTASVKAAGRAGASFAGFTHPTGLLVSALALAADADALTDAADADAAAATEVSIFLPLRLTR
jgi:hypothetical protein